jgi:hypothetical protein
MDIVQENMEAKQQEMGNIQEKMEAAVNSI